jgi:hypothetical protein
MAALGLALFTISSPATGHPVPPVPTAGFHDVFALTTGPTMRGRWPLSRPLPVRPAQMNSRGDLDDS